MSMAHSVESRPAFLDHLLWEYVAKLPPELKLSPDGNKYLLRLGMKGSPSRSSAELAPREVLAPQIMPGGERINYPPGLKNI